MVLPLLYSQKLIDQEEYRKLNMSKGKETERKRGEILLMDVLMKKEQGSFDKFCDILRKIPDQKHIANIIRPLTSTASVVLRASTFGRL